MATEIDGHPHVVDLSDPDAIDSLPVEVEVLVNNAGLQYVSPIERFPPTGSQ